MISIRMPVRRFWRTDRFILPCAADAYELRRGIRRSHPLCLFSKRKLRGILQPAFPAYVVRFSGVRIQTAVEVFGQTVRPYADIFFSGSSHAYAQKAYARTEIRFQ